MANADRVRANTAEEINRQIDRDIDVSAREYATRSPADITRRIEELDREWDMERFSRPTHPQLLLRGCCLA